MAPKKPTLFRVGWCNTTGSLHSGGTHIRHLDPCCWKWTSSKDQRSISPARTYSVIFLKASCLSGSALAIRGRGFLSRKPSRRNKRWHWRTPRSTPNCCRMKWESNLPSHKLPASPYCDGCERNANSINWICCSSSLLGLPDRSASASPESPSASNRFTQ